MNMRDSILNLIRWPLVVACLVALSDTSRSQDPSTRDFFETKIRPVLIEHCYPCHSGQSDEISGSLRVDSRESLRRGGDSGPAVNEGDPSGSLLMSAIRYETYEMPPSGKLPAQVIDDFEAWIHAGAVDPREGGSEKMDSITEIDWDSARAFWAFRSRKIENPSTPAIPANLKGSYPTTGFLDDHLNWRLMKSEIQPSPPAKPELQLRRLCYDLTGLPPTIEMQDEWLADPSDLRWKQLVNQLLASPAFGEHWARHWMDVARYADSNGSDFNATFHEAWRYRDYLIRSFNMDQSLQRMIRQQIAGDLLPYSDDQERYDNVVATTFLMLGPKMLSERDKEKLKLDVIDEQIDTVGRAFLGLTLGCARCHDHKFDPIPTEDYYALAGIFQSTQTLNGESQKYVSTWNRVDLPATDEERQAIKNHQHEVKRLETQIKDTESSLKKLKEKLTPSISGIVLDDADAEKSGPWTSSTYFEHFIGKGYVHDDAKNKGDAKIEYMTRLPVTGRYEVRVSHSPGANRAANVPVKLTTSTGDVEIIWDQRKISIEPMWHSLGVYDLASDQPTRLTISNNGTSGYVIADAVQFIPQDGAEASPQTDQQAEEQLEVESRQEHLSELKSQLKRLKKDAPDPLPVAMAPSDRSKKAISDSHLHIRGEVRNLGPVIPRGFLTVLKPNEPYPLDTETSGRAELAEWLTDANHPLVSRVFVNRVWMHFFGEGIVRTVDNFGKQGEKPSHPELLDHLAKDFVESGWHLKPLIRKLVLSRAYRRSSSRQSDSMLRDPENRLLWRANRRRLSAESIRDSMIACSGYLDSTARVKPMSGRGVLVSSNNADSSAKMNETTESCRSIYLPVVRGYLSDFLLALDMADPDLLVGKRPTTNVPSQALALINSEEVNQWAAQTTSRVLDEVMSLDSRVEKVTRLLLQRYPREQEILLAREFFREREEDPDAWNQYISAVYASSPFRFLD